jgi:hypothetical protein
MSSEVRKPEVGEVWLLDQCYVDDVLIDNIVYIKDDECYVYLECAYPELIGKDFPRCHVTKFQEYLPLYNTPLYKAVKGIK